MMGYVQDKAEGREGSKIQTLTVTFQSAGAHKSDLEQQDDVGRGEGVDVVGQEEGGRQ